MSAYACVPGGGSERGIGWNWAVQASRFHDVWVLTRAKHRAAIECELARHPNSRLRFIYHDLPAWARWWKRGNRGVNLYYLLWQLTSIRVVRREHELQRFDIGHHITLGSFRHPSVLAWSGIPYIWGPVGGGEQAPRRFYPSFGVRGFVQEVVRDVSNQFTRLNPLVLRTARHAALIVCTTPDTVERLPGDIEAKARAIPATGVDTWPDRHARPASQPGAVRLLYVGRLLHWKGVHVAIQALAQAVGAGVAAELTVIGNGPFGSALRRVAAETNTLDRVHFVEGMPRDEVLHLYSEHNVLVFPSFHDSGGFVVLEAMASGLPVICLDLGGPALAVSDDTGFKIPARDPAQVVTDMSQAIVTMARDRQLREAMGAAGRQRVREVYSWDRKGEFLRQLYEETVTQTPDISK